MRRGGIVLCPPLAHEFDFAHRLFVEWARNLTERGWSVLRFDYRGHGDSSGTFDQLTLADYADDIRRAIAAFEQRSGIRCHALGGLRWGATLAAQVWSELARPGPLILWEPILDGPQYLNGLLRTLLAKQMARPTGPARTRAELKQEIEAGGEVILEGRPLRPPFVRSLEGFDFPAIIPRLSAPTLLGEVRKQATGPVNRKLAQLHAKWSGKGTCEHASIAAPPLWFGSLIQDYAPRVTPDELFQITGDWLAERWGAEMQTADDRSGDAAAFRSKQDPRRKRPAIAVESVACFDTQETDQPIQFSVQGHRCTGILHTPPAWDSSRPVILFPPQGMNLRSGWNQLHQRLAKRLGEAGWASLRFDARGLGNSEGSLDFRTGADLFHSIETGGHIPDTLEAITWLEHNRDIHSVILIGVCGGAVTAGMLSGGDPRIAAVGLIELPLVFSRHPSERDGEPLWRYRDRLLSRKAWQKLLALRIDLRFHLRSLQTAAARRWRRGRQMQRDDRWLADQLGERVNLPLIHCLRQACAIQQPTLLTFGSTDNVEMYDRVRAVIHAQGSRQVTRRSVTGSDHDFLLPEHARQLGEVVAEWLEETFPVHEGTSVDAPGDHHFELPNA